MPTVSVQSEAPEGGPVVYCGIGSWGARCLSLADYVTRTGAHPRGVPRGRF